jgi:hypothetical protein
VNPATFDLTARIKQDSKALLPDGTTFNVWTGETFPIERIGNGGIYIRTVFGEGFIAYASFSYHVDEDEDCGPLCPTHGDVRDTSAVR